MRKPKPDSVESLFQVDVIDDFLPRIGKEQWQTLYLSSDQMHGQYGIWCALLSDDAAAIALSVDSWDHMIGDGMPGFSGGPFEGRIIATYHQFGHREGIRPLVLYRSFHGAFPQYVEMAEEFRLYHNLAEDKGRGLLLSFDDSGREIQVARIERSGVHAKLKYLRQFQAGLNLHLAIYVDSIRYSPTPIVEIPADERKRVTVEQNIRWRRDIVEDHLHDGFQSFSRVLAKVVLAPPPIEEAGVWPFEKEDSREIRFIVGVDGEGNEVEFTSDPDKLSNSDGGTEQTPHYLTPIHFRREVLTKYFAEPERYSVSDSYLSCLNLWGCRIDNNHETRVVVLLGDLGRDLPYDERLHWRQFNLAPDGGVSETYFRRNFLSEFADPKAPDLVFRQEYLVTNRDWERVHSWPLFLKTLPGDAHLIHTIRIPVADSQAEFDEQVGKLAKLLVDALNEKELEARAGDLDKGTKGIGKLSGFLCETGFPEREHVVQFWRDIQDLRSAGTAHLKGSRYTKVLTRLRLDGMPRSEAVRRFLVNAASMLRSLRGYYCGKSAGTE